MFYFQLFEIRRYSLKNVPTAPHTNVVNLRIFHNLNLDSIPEEILNEDPLQSPLLSVNQLPEESQIACSVGAPKRTRKFYLLFFKICIIR